MRIPVPLLALTAVLGCQSSDERSAAPALESATAMPAASAITPTDSTSRSSSRWVATPTGLGPVVAGMPVTELSRALGETITPKYSEGSGCGFVRAAALPADVLVMILHDSVARVDVRNREVRTAAGVGVGDAEQRVLAAYDSRVTSSPHKYTGPTGHYLTVSALPDTAHLIVFETDGRVVTNYRVGRRAAVELVEGCS